MQEQLAVAAEQFKESLFDITAELEAPLQELLDIGKQKVEQDAAAYEDFKKTLSETDFMFPDDIFEPSERSSKMFDSIRDAAKKQNEAAAAQEKAAVVQERAAEALEKIAGGDKEVKVKVDLSGTEPELEAFVWKLVELAQYRATFNGSEFLIGLPIQV